MSHHDKALTVKDVVTFFTLASSMVAMFLTLDSRMDSKIEKSEEKNHQIYMVDSISMKSDLTDLKMGVKRIEDIMLQNSSKL